MPFDKQNTLGRENTSRMVICKIFGDYLLCGFDGLVKKDDDEESTIKPSCGCDPKNDPYGQDIKKYINYLITREGGDATKNKKIFRYREQLSQMAERPTVDAPEADGSEGISSGAGSSTGTDSPDGNLASSSSTLPSWCSIDKDEESAICVRVEDISGKTPTLITALSGKFIFNCDNDCYVLQQKAGEQFNNFTIQATPSEDSTGMSVWDWVIQTDYKGLAFPVLFENAKVDENFKLTGSQLPVGKTVESIDGIGEQGAKVRVKVESAVSGTTGTCDIKETTTTTTCPEDCQTFQPSDFQILGESPNKVIELESASSYDFSTDKYSSGFNGGLSWTGTDCWTGKTFTVSGKDSEGKDVSAPVKIATSLTKGECTEGCRETVTTDELSAVLDDLDANQPITFCPSKPTTTTSGSNATLCEGENKRLFYVSKPHALQVTPWNGKPSSNAEVSKYVYEGMDGDASNRRVAKYTEETYRCTRGDHDERIDPPYVVGDTIEVKKLIGEQSDESVAHLPQEGEVDDDGEPKSMARFMVDTTARVWTDDCAADAGQGSIWV